MTPSTIFIIGMVAGAALLILVDLIVSSIIRARRRKKQQEAIKKFTDAFKGLCHTIEDINKEALKSFWHGIEDKMAAQKSIEDQIKEAIKNEDYERAAKLRDKL